MADALDATLVQQNYSRLVIDCNRTPGSETSIPEVSELTPVPGNVGLSETAKAARVREIFRPYHDAIESELDRRRQRGRPAALIAMHSFTPVFKGVARPWHAGVLYNRDPRFAHLLMALLKREAGLVVGDNEPYSVTDRVGLHHSGARRAAWPASRCDRDPPGPDRRRQGPARGVRCSRACCRRRIRSWWQPRRPSLPNFH